MIKCIVLVKVRSILKYHEIKFSFFLHRKIQEESLRTYLFTYNRVYDSLRYLYIQRKANCRNACSSSNTYYLHWKNFCTISLMKISVNCYASLSPGNVKSKLVFLHENILFALFLSYYHS